MLTMADNTPGCLFYISLDMFSIAIAGKRLQNLSLHPPYALYFLKARIVQFFFANKAKFMLSIQLKFSHMFVVKPLLQNTSIAYQIESMVKIKLF
jgi:hypothetical protein